MFELKPLSRDGIPGALEKAIRYRLLNEPGDAESICLDILAIDPNNQEAIVTLLLAATDGSTQPYQIGAVDIKELIARLDDEYSRFYYSGIVDERAAKDHLDSRTEYGREYAYDHLRDAMHWFEKAQSIHPPGNDDAILRWNTCARIIQNNNLKVRVEVELSLE
ncbi:MAG: hypothetical protein ABIP75_18885 [Pyrinomonadaceae bacterium]